MSSISNILKGAMIGTGFFAHMQMPAWHKIAEAEIVAVCDLDEAKAKAFAEQYGIAKVYTSVNKLLATEQLDFVDIVTRPDSHRMLVEKAAQRGLAILCQKPLAPTFGESQEIIRITKKQNVRFMVNENWRWQAWYREMESLVDTGKLGDLFHANVNMRTGDGRGETPYNHQPYFKDYPRLLVFETVVHFIDTLRMFLGEVSQVYAVHKRLNPVIRGEDQSLITLEFESGATAIIDAKAPKGKGKNKSKPSY